MADRWAFFVAVEKYLHPAFGPVPFAESDAAAVAAALEKCGVPAARQVMLRGEYATKAAIESKLRRFKKTLKKGDDVIAGWFGRGGTDGEKGFLPCRDTLPDDAAETSVALADWAAAFAGSKAERAVFLFAGGPDEADQLPVEEVRELFGDSPHAVALFASGPGEPANAAEKYGVWAKILLDALGGTARGAADAAGKVTAGSLQKFIEAELPRRLRKHFEAGVRQTPLLVGEKNAGFVIADVTPVAAADGGAVLDPGRMRRVIFRNEAETRVKDLSQFRKTFKIPDNTSPSNRKFIARLAAPDLKADLDRVFDAAREHLGYKRKDMEVAAGTEGYGSLRTPDFEYTAFLDLAEHDPTRIVWRREAGHFADPGFVRGPGFAAVFGTTFDRLVFEFARPIDVEAFIDAIEENPPPGVKVAVESDGSGCDITIAKFAGVVAVRSHNLTVRGRSGPAAGLLDVFMQFVKNFGGLGEQPALPPARGD